MRDIKLFVKQFLIYLGIAVLLGVAMWVTRLGIGGFMYGPTGSLGRAAAATIFAVGFFIVCCISFTFFYLQVKRKNPNAAVSAQSISELQADARKRIAAFGRRYFFHFCVGAILLALVVAIVDSVAR